MRFNNPTQAQQLLLDDRTSGFFDRVRNADYVFYEERDGGWFPVRSVSGIRSKRYKALRRQDSLVLELESNDIRLSDRVEVQGQITVNYQLERADRIVFMSPTGICNELLGRVKRVLSNYLSRLASNELGLEKSWLIETSNSEFRKDADDYGYTLTIEAFEPITALDDVIECGIIEDRKQDHDLERRRKEMLLEVERYERMALAEAKKAYAMLAVKQKELEMEAEHLRRIRMIDVDQAKMWDDLFVQKVSRIAQLPPDVIAAAIALADPNPGSAMAEMMRARVAATTYGDAMSLLLALITNKPGSQSSAQSQGNILLPNPESSIVVSDPVLDQLKAAGYETTPQGNHYLITVSNLGHTKYYIKLQLNGEHVSMIHHGSTPATQNRWTGKIIRDNPVAAVNLVVQELRKRRL